MPFNHPSKSRGASMPVRSSHSNFLEDMYRRKTEVENRRNALWNSTANYFEKQQRQNKLFEVWNSTEFADKSAQAFQRAKLAEAHKSDVSDGGHPRPEHVLRRAERRFIEAVNSDIPHQGEKNMKREKDLLAAKRHQKQKEEANQLMEQHWKINDPGFNKLFSKKSTSFIKVPSERQVSWKDTKPGHAEIETDEEIEKNIEELEKKVEKEQKMFEEKVESNLAKNREDQLEHWKETIMKYIDDSKILKEKEEKLEAELRRDEYLDSSLTQIVDKRRKLDEKLDEGDLENGFYRQYRLRLHAKSLQVEKEIDDEIRIAQELGNLFKSDSDELSDIFSKIIIYCDRLECQKSLESRTRTQWGFLFSEEAFKTWSNQSQKWSQERQNRVQLFQNFVESLREQLRIRIQSKRQSLESCRQSRQSVDDAVDQLTSDLQQEEERLRQKESAMPAIVLEDLEDLSLDKEEVAPSREEKFRQKNEIASKVFEWSAAHEHQEFGDFRRKKVNWFY